MTIEQEARDLMNGVCYERSDLRPYGDDAQRENTAVLEAICRALEQCDAERQAHADFRQRVSDAMKVLQNGFGGVNYVVMSGGGQVTFSDFIIPKPVDPLVEAVKELGDWVHNGEPIETAARLRAACIKHGIPIPDKREEG